MKDKIMTAITKVYAITEILDIDENDPVTIFKAGYEACRIHKRHINKKDGWIIDFSYLQKVQKKIKEIETYYNPTLEDIEIILLSDESLKIGG